MATVATHVIDVNEQTFITEVLERSQTVPVVVDFWAEWCGPCRMLGPTLERLAEEYDGAFVLAKVDVDQCPQLSTQFGVQGIPAVKAFKNNQVVEEFTGALPEPQVRQFLEKLIPSPADILVEEGDVLYENGNAADAAAKYREALALKSSHYSAKLGLGQVLIDLGETDEATNLLQSIPAGVPEGAKAEALLASLQFEQHAAGRSEAELKAAIEADGKDVASRFALASMLASQDRYQEALDEFLEIVYRDRSFEDDGARKAILALLTNLGDEHPLTSPYRRKLSMALF
ncbi:MAG: thioredoxin [Chloroflexota bacterium]